MDNLTGMHIGCGNAADQKYMTSSLLWKTNDQQYTYTVSKDKIVSKVQMIQSSNNATGGATGPHKVQMIQSSRFK